MVGSQHDDRVVGERALIEGLEHATNLVVDEPDARQVGPHGVAPLLILVASRGALPGTCGWTVGQIGSREKADVAQMPAGRCQASSFARITSRLAASTPSVRER